jgi:hypothetical protein
MTEVAVTIGWKLIDDNNNVVGFKCDYTDNGRCYKDISAYDKQTIMSPIYIPECEFEDEDIVYVDEVTQITEAGTYYAEWINFVRDLLNEKKCTVDVLETKDRWFGVTYKEDKPDVVKSVQDLVDNGVYPEKLW